MAFRAGSCLVYYCTILASEHTTSSRQVAVLILSGIVMPCHVMQAHAMDAISSLISYCLCRGARLPERQVQAKSREEDTGSYLLGTYLVDSRGANRKSTQRVVDRYIAMKGKKKKKKKKATAHS